MSMSMSGMGMGIGRGGKVLACFTSNSMPLMLGLSLDNAGLWLVPTLLQHLCRYLYYLVYLCLCLRLRLCLYLGLCLSLSLSLYLCRCLCLLCLHLKHHNGLGHRSFSCHDGGGRQVSIAVPVQIQGSKRSMMPVWMIGLRKCCEQRVVDGTTVPESPAYRPSSGCRSLDP